LNNGIIPIMKRWIEVPFRFRTLFRGFVSNEIRGRFAGSMGGFLWSILTPLATLLIYIFVFSTVFQIRLKPVETGTDSFVVFFLAGILPWAAFSEAVGNATNIFLGKADLITKVAFPLEVLPIAGVVVPFFLNGFGFVMFLGYLVFKGCFQVRWLWLPVVVSAHMVFTLGLVTLIGSLCVFLRDIKQFIGITLTLWFFMTPILYPSSMVPEKLRWIIKVNPMSPFIELYHQVLLQGNFSWGLLGHAIGLAILFFIVGIVFFGRSKYAFADVL
jgi:lipopolysaccharide transport system permease protein